MKTNAPTRARFSSCIGGTCTPHRTLDEAEAAVREADIHGTPITPTDEPFRAYDGQPRIVRRYYQPRPGGGFLCIGSVMLPGKGGAL